jgi:hypothetical protein
MVAVIKTGHSILRLLNYNENKVKEGVAVCIAAENYPMDAADLSFQQKLARLVNQAALNENVTRNSVHISLNFDPSENHAEERLKEIADAYMKGIGFDDLPYLMYQHFDAGHPHIHIVSVKVRADGSRVNTQNIGRNQSEKARKEIELKFGLVKAEDSQRQQAFRLKPVNAARVQYGRSETKRAIGNVLETVLPHYKFASLPELNAILQQYNLVADRGSESSRVFQHHGLVYRVLDEAGNKVGVPIKASDFYSKPTLKLLEQRFGSNIAAKEPHRARIKNVIDRSLLHGRTDLQGLVAALKTDGIDTVIRQNDDGLIYGITFIDHRSKVVFNGSALGKTYSAKAILERCSGGQAGEGKTKVLVPGQVTGDRTDPQDKQAVEPGVKRSAAIGDKATGLPGLKNLAEALLQPEDQSERMYWQLSRSKKKKKRPRIEPS